MIIEPNFRTQDALNRSYIDDDTVVGLYTDKPFENGYVGYYNYHPKERVYLSGKVPNATSTPLYKAQVQKNSRTFEKKINTVLNRASAARKIDRAVTVGDEPINIKRISESKDRAETIVSQIKDKGSPETKRSPEERIEVERKKY